MRTLRPPKAPFEVVIPTFAAIVVVLGAVASILLNWVFDDNIGAQIVGTWTAIFGSWILAGLTLLMGNTFNIWRKQQAEWIKEWGLIQQELARRREFGD